MEKTIKNNQSKNTSLAKTIADQINDYIQKQNLKPGDRIETELEMAKKLNVSRGTIREAVKILVSRNVLEVHKGSGTYISKKKGITEDPLGLSFITDKKKLTWDLLEFRMMVEPQIAFLAAQNITSSQINLLEKLCNQADFLSSQGQIRAEEDVEFHICIAEASGNLVAPNLIPIIRKATELFIQYTGREKAPETVARHRDILEALKQHDASWAKEMMTMHLTFNRQILRKTIFHTDKKGVPNEQEKSLFQL
ncbi:FadR/GntR family transcriptional regulator [Blautia sp.]|nr:FadR/GntR family transcriptional regulator [Blautia sp.]MED9883566.1 FadR/GntR family transcriptional regulator [Blautia sp.]